MDPVVQFFQVLASVVVLLLLVALFHRPNVIPTTREGGLEALKQIQEWSKWMAGIQTAGFAALAILAFEKDSSVIREVDDWWRCRLGKPFTFSLRVSA